MRIRISFHRPAEYIIVISERTRSCRLLGHDVSLATAFRLLPISPNTPRPLPQLERHLLDLVSQGLNSGQLWFSYGWDLTNSLERQWWNEKAKSKGRADERGETNMSEAADDRFFWNKALMRKFLEVGRGVGGAAEDGDVSSLHEVEARTGQRGTDPSLYLNS